MSRIYLRELTRDDLEQLHLWRQSKELSQYFGSPYRYTNLETEHEWFEHYLSSRQTQVRLAICRQQDHQHIGNVYLLNLDWVYRQAELSLFIAEPSQRGKGYGKEATLNVLRHGFNDLNLHRIELQVMENNLAAIQLYKTCGFIKEGQRRQAIYKDGHYRDIILMALLKADFCEMAFDIG